MKNGLKVVTIGGGSSYTPELVEGFIKRHAQLPVRELWLVDIDAGKEKLETVGALAKRMVKKSGIDMTIHLSYDRREALKDADFVTTQLRVGLLEARIKDERIPLSHGVIGQETNGAGGLFKALRTVPVIFEIIKDIQELCPNAWLVNFTNPTGVITEAVFKYTNFKRYVGLCNVPIGVKNGIADFMKMDPSEIQMEFAGLNHMVYGKNVRINGQDVTEEVIGKFVDAKVSMQNIKALDYNADFIKALNLLPCPYHRYYYKTSEMLEDELKEFAKGETRGEVVKALEDSLFELYKDENLAIKPPQLEKRGGAYYSDVACNLISSIYNDTGDIQVVNTLNNGAILNFRPDEAVEVSCVITKEGPRPLAMGYLPDAVDGLLRQIKSFEKLAAHAAVHGDYDAALLALATNPLIPSDDLAQTILDEMLEAHATYLPQFKK
ncbi:MAG: 6-phospho-beta-glucosidase [Turicibacter sp.]